MTERIESNSDISVADKCQPLVSVMIRTINRSTLQDSVNSVLQQTYGNIEILVVSALGIPLLELEHRAFEKVIILNFNSLLSRSAAANALLDHAKGEFAIFLDDDDLFEKNHIQNLVQGLSEDPELIAVYSDVQCNIYSNDAVISSQLFQQDFNKGLILLKNYLPIHSVLFRLSVTRGEFPIRFDENLDLFEDWDFWLQIVDRNCGISRVPGLSAVYNLNRDTGSGHNELANAHREAMLIRFASRLLSRITPSDYVSIINNEAEQTNRVNQLHQEVVELHCEIGKRDITIIEVQQVSERLRERAVEDHRNAAARIQALEEALEERRLLIDLQQAELEKLSRLRLEHLQIIEDSQATLMAMSRSNSWRLTRPLRVMRRLIGWLFSPSFRSFLNNCKLAYGAALRRYGFIGFIRRMPFYVRRAPALLPVLISRPPSHAASVYRTVRSEMRSVKLHPDLVLKDGMVEQIDTKVSIIIPTLNAGPEFRILLRKLRAQRGVREVEIVIVDSGSTDQTVGWARESECRIVEIQPSEFSHSYARNLGADTSTGDYLVFMVQDAYPIGNFWLYGMLSYLIEHAEQGLVAASCAEYSRSDSDMMYDSMINTHYLFLGCLEVDRIGEFRGSDHMSLRSQGQLSDVSCLISRDIFQRFRYQGNYAEDLDLGIRIIKDGYKVAMLASIKVIHSHNRSAHYYLKRSFVDVIFLVRLFDDFSYASCQSVEGLFSGVISTAVKVSEWIKDQSKDGTMKELGDVVSDWVKSPTGHLLDIDSEAVIELGDERLNLYIQGLSKRYLKSGPLKLDRRGKDEALRFSDMFLARLNHFNEFSRIVYGRQDERLRHELGQAVSKIFAATLGSVLGFLYLERSASDHPDRGIVDVIYHELHSGV